MNELILVFVTTAVFYLIFKKVLKKPVENTYGDQKENPFQKKAADLIEQKKKSEKENPSLKK